MPRITAQGTDAVSVKSVTGAKRRRCIWGQLKATSSVSPTDSIATVLCVNKYVLCGHIRHKMTIISEWEVTKVIYKKAKL